MNKSSDTSIAESHNSSDSLNQAVLESSPDCLKILDADGRLQYMNFNGLCQMEIDDFSALRGNLWWDLWGKENEHLVKEAVAKAVKGEATEFSAFCATAKGTPKWWQVTVTPFGTPENGKFQLLSVSRDITDQKKAEEEIIKLNNLLEEKVKLRTEELLAKNIELEKANSELAIFNYIASHDLQEPLRKIQFFSNLILDAENDPVVRRHNLNRILSTSQRMRNLIDDLQKFSITKDAEFTFDDCNLNEIIADVIDNSEFTITEKNAVIDVRSLPIITGSKLLITQLLINLLDNSLKYSRENVAPVISITSSKVDGSKLAFPHAGDIDQYHVLKITDNGIGFPNEYKEQIFKIFKRLHAKDSFSGTGIGLAICKTIVHKHNGWIDAVSEPGTGSTFLIYFPIHM